MKAFLNKQTNLFELRDGDKLVPNLPKFKRFLAGIGWGREDKPDDYADTWLTMFGEQEDNRIMQLVEAKGTLQQIGKEAINLKDRFFCKSFYVDASEIHNQKVRYLRTIEGLTRYEHKQGILRPIYPTDTKTWPHFRAERPTAAVIPVPDDIRADIGAAFSITYALATEQKQLIFYGACERLALFVLKSKVKDRKREETHSHPVVVASVYAVSMLMRSRPQAGQKQKVQSNPYPNRAR